MRDVARLRVCHRGAAVDVALPSHSVASLVAGLAPSTQVGPAAGREGPSHARVSLAVRGDGGWRVFGGGERLAHGTFGSGAGGDLRLSSEVHLAIAAHAPNHVFVHAGAVSWRGRAILIPGRSMAGKTTLVQALLALGASHLSDEYAVIDADGLVHPYARPLSVRGPNGRTRVAPTDLGAVECEPCPVGVVVQTRYEAGATWAPVRQRSAGVVLPLVDNAVAAQLAPHRVLDHVTAVARARPLMLTGARGDATETARAILAEADRERTRTQVRVAVPG